MRNNEAYFHKYPITLITKNNQEIGVRNVGAAQSRKRRQNIVYRGINFTAARVESHLSSFFGAKARRNFVTSSFRPFL